MKTFWVDFSGSMEVEADSYEEARKKFYEQLPEGIEYPEIDNIECQDEDDEDEEDEDEEE